LQDVIRGVEAVMTLYLSNISLARNSDFILRVRTQLLRERRINSALRYK